MQEIRICVIGLGYVGLPLARLFSTKFKTIGFDLNQTRVDALNSGKDTTLEVSDELLQEAIEKHGFRCTTNIEEINSIIPSKLLSEKYFICWQVKQGRY